MKVLKVLMALVCLVLLLVLAGGTYVKFALPDVGPAPEMTIKSTPQRL
jgi:hypothetical protein